MDFRGLKGLIPYRKVEEAVSKTGYAELSLDDEAVDIVRMWAERAGYRVDVSGGVVRIYAEIGKTRGSPVAIPVSDDKWSMDLGERIGNYSVYTDLVLKSVKLYWGEWNPEEVAKALSAADTLLIRVSMERDYVFVVKDGEVVAGSDFSKPLKPEQARRILDAARRRSGAKISIYRIPRGAVEP